MEELKTLLLVDGIVSLKVAKLLKKHDFHERCRTYYNTSVELSYTQLNSCDYNTSVELSYTQLNSCDDNRDVYFFASAPTLALAQQWLRVKYGINVFVHPKYIDMRLNYCVTIIRVDNLTKKCRWTKRVLDSYNRIITYEDYNEALDEGLYKALTFL